MTPSILPPKQTAPALPTAGELAQSLDLLLGIIVVNLNKMGVAPPMLKAIGTLMTELKFDGTQSKEVVAALINKQAVALEEEVKLLSLRQSILTTSPTKIN